MLGVLPLLSFSLVVLTVAGVAHAAPPTCALDMGSNTFKRIVGRFENGRYAETSIEKITLAVGDDVARNGRISAGKLAEIDATLGRFKAACAREGATPIVAVGTAAFRDAVNGARTIEIAAKHGIAMEIADEKRESELAYLVGSLGQDGLAVIDNGSRSIELAARSGALQYSVFNLGYRVAYEAFFAAAADPAPAVRAFRDRLSSELSNAAFMKGKSKLVGVEFGDMIDVLFARVPVEGRVLTIEELRGRLAQIMSSSASEFAALKQKPNIDRALPRLVAAVVLAEGFGYPSLELTARELGAGLIIEAGTKRR